MHESVWKTAKPTDLDKAQATRWLEHLSPQETLGRAIDTFGPDLLMTSAFGLNGVALIHMLQKFTRDIPIVFLDTGYLFEETLETKRRIEVVYGVQVLTFRATERMEVQVDQIGPQLSNHWPHLCCTARKVEPMRQAVAELRPLAILNGRARFQAHTRRNLPTVEWDKTPVRINPLAHWSQQQVEDYVKAHDVPYNPLHDLGYTSIGCWPCTQPAAEGDDIRAGRWVDLEKVECGLWTQPMACRPQPARTGPCEDLGFAFGERD